MITQALDLLKNNKTGSFKLSNDEVMVTTQNAIVLRFYKHEKPEQVVLAAKINQSIVGNSSNLSELLSHRGSLGRRNRNRVAVLEEQTQLSQLVPMIPFSVMREAGLKLDTFTQIESGGEETIYRRVTEDHHDTRSVAELKLDPKVRNVKIIKEYDSYGDAKKKLLQVSFERAEHFTGARLFQVGSTRFLLDIDRVELTNGIVNPFLVSLVNSNVSTIAEAYQSLKPTEVVEAEARGAKVLRQGEWFFIPQDEVTQARAKAAHQAVIDEASKNESKEWATRWAGRGELRAGRNRPNQTEKFIELNGKHYVSGKVSHTGREHADIILKGFYLAVPNTSQTSWQITGDID